MNPYHESYGTVCFVRHCWPSWEGAAGAERRRDRVMALRYTSERLETCADNGNWDKLVVPLLTEIFELMDENQDGSVDEVEGALVNGTTICFRTCFLRRFFTTTLSDTGNT